LLEAEQEIRSIEKSFDCFYYPLKLYLEDRPEPRSRKVEDIEKIACYMYLAEEKTRTQFEKFQKEGFPIYGGHEENNIKLLHLVTTDIKSKESRLRMLKKI
jgi:hypothetical protein